MPLFVDLSCTLKPNTSLKRLIKNKIKNNKPNAPTFTNAEIKELCELIIPPAA